MWVCVCVSVLPQQMLAVPGLYSKEFLENRMCVALGGRLAEEIINGKDNVTTGFYMALAGGRCMIGKLYARCLQ